MIKINNKILIKNTIYCNSLYSRTKGLMFRTNLDKDTAYVLINNKDSIKDSSIHTFFVFFPIDVLWVNSKKIIVDKRENVKPFKLLIKSKKPAKYIIELKRGKAKNIKIGDKIEFKGYK